MALFAAEINRRPDRDRAHVERLFHAANMI